jgi:hypothetical protein
MILVLDGTREKTKSQTSQRQFFTQRRLTAPGGRHDKGDCIYGSILRWMQITPYPDSPRCHEGPPIETQCLDRGSTNGSPAHNPC